MSFLTSFLLMDAFCHLFAMLSQNGGGGGVGGYKSDNGKAEILRAISF